MGKSFCLNAVAQIPKKTGLLLPHQFVMISVTLRKFTGLFPDFEEHFPAGTVSFVDQR
jgi:hypothetical protein